MVTASSGAPSWAQESCLMGIDEAGRGPVLGPMVYGCAFCPLDQKERISSLQFADSKVLTEAKRDELYASILADSSMGWAVDVIDPRDLSAQMLCRERRSLNMISFESAMGLIRSTLNLGVSLAEVFVDTVGDPAKYEASLTERFPGIKFTVSKKADSLFPIVSAASIIAKVTRDKALREWVMEETGKDVGRSFGSGYPGDPDTKSWLEQNSNPVFGFPSVVRFSWATCKPYFTKGGVDIFWLASPISTCPPDFVSCKYVGSDPLDGSDDDEETERRKSKIVETESCAPLRHSFFRSRQLQQVTTHL
ncbi:unnamed protein product [Sphagnum jensenii]|uniref:Ribonuclease n=1 Tax=Sphagnum jensenii TaxID=128206 RepID=A0ABP0W9B4_9BRYO